MKIVQKNLSVTFFSFLSFFFIFHRVNLLEPEILVERLDETTRSMVALLVFRARRRKGPAVQDGCQELRSSYPATENDGVVSLLEYRKNSCDSPSDHPRELSH